MDIDILSVVGVALAAIVTITLIFIGGHRTGGRSKRTGAAAPASGAVYVATDGGGGAGSCDGGGGSCS